MTVLTYSTCADCGDPVIVTEPGQTTHPGCTAQTTEVEWLAEQWLAAALAGEDGEADRIESKMAEMDGRAPRLTAAAGLYASWGWPVFPLKAPCGVPGGCSRCKGATPCGKRPATRHGFKDATTDADRIHAWWTRHPDHNIGLPTGVRFDVIDIDVPKPTQPIPGAIAYAKMLTATRRDGSLLLAECHGQVSTASGGLHLYVPATGKGNRAGMRPGVDYRGLGGYVVAPPSTLTGHRRRSWTWMVKPSPRIAGRRA